MQQDELSFSFVKEIDDIQCLQDLQKCIGTIVMYDQLLLIKVAYLTVAMKGGSKDLAIQVHNLLKKKNFELIAGFKESASRRGYDVRREQKYLHDVDKIRRRWEHDIYSQLIKIKTNTEFNNYVKTIKSTLKNDLNMLIDINTLFNVDFADYFNDNRWFKQCLKLKKN